MIRIRSTIAAAVLGITVVGAATQLAGFGDGPARAAAGTTGNQSATHQPAHRGTHPPSNHDDGHLEANTALDRTSNTETTRATGLILDDVEVSAARVGASRKVGIPASVDLRQWAMPVANQGQVNSCVAWTIDYAMFGWYAKHDGVAGAPFAPMFAYSQINGGVDKGSQPADALQLAATAGADPKADYWQGDYDWRTQPTAAQKANASHYKIKGYDAVFSGRNGQGSAGANALANTLAAGKPVAIAMAVRNGFSALNATNAVDHDTTNPVTGYHEVLAVGYDSNGVIIQNSWGTNWGSKGFGWLDWNVVGADVYSAYTISGLTSTATTDTNTNTDTTTTTATVGAVNVGVAPGYHVTANVPVTAFWSATGAVSRYQIWTSTDGGNWVDSSARLSAGNAASASFGLAAGHTYRFAVAAVDAAGKRSPFSYSATFTPSVTDDSAVTFSNGWSRYDWTSAYGGQGVTSTTSGATATLSFTGRSVAMVAPKFASAGQVRIYLDGNYDSTIDLAKASLDPQAVAFSHYWPTAKAHTITVQVVGTNGRPRVDVDAFAILN